MQNSGINTNESDTLNKLSNTGFAYKIAILEHPFLYV